MRDSILLREFTQTCVPLINPAYSFQSLWLSPSVLLEQLSPSDELTADDTICALLSIPGGVGLSDPAKECQRLDLEP
jgi:hypothetical protein